MISKSVNKKPKDVAPIPLRAVCVPWGHITASQFDRLACPECGKPIAHAVTRVDVVKYVFKCGCEFERRIVVGGKCE